MMRRMSGGAGASGGGVFALANQGQAIRKGQSAE